MLVLDAGAFVAVERGSREVVALIKRERLAGRAPVTSGGVVAQVWRGGSGRQVLIARLLAGTDVAPLDDRLGRRAGMFLARSGQSEAIGLAIAVGLYAVVFVYDYVRLGETPGAPGAYRVVPPPLFEGARLSAAAGSGSSVWSDGIKRFPGATPVSAVYDKDGKPWLYVWGAEGKLADPAAELTAFWQASDPAATQLNIPLTPGDAEWAGPLGGDLQCQELYQVCAWADDSGIVVVSPQPFNQADFITVGKGATISEQGMAAMRLSFRGAAEHLRHATQTHH